MSEIQKKKRGRKPKNFNIIQAKVDNIKEIDDLINTEEEKIIFHLPITIEEVNNAVAVDVDVAVDTDIFIKSEKDIFYSKINIKNDSELTETLKTSISISKTNQNCANNSIHKIATHNLIFSQNTKCWWCRNCFNTPGLELPEDYYNETFFCTGNYCSFNCMKSYNLDLNDSLTFKRDSLIYLLY